MHTLSDRAAALRLFGVGLTALFWELVLIRWTGACLRIVAYYSNFVLIAAFFGLGLGALLARHPQRLWRALPVTIGIAVTAALAMSGTLHANLVTPDEFVWIGSPQAVPSPDWAPKALPGGVVLLTAYVLVSSVFVGFGQWLGHLFRALPPMRAYTAEIAGSVAGIVLFGLLSAAATPPTVWFAVGFALLVPLLWRDRPALGSVVAAGLLVWFVANPYVAAHHWSPYYKILDRPLDALLDERGVEQPIGSEIGRTISVNNDFHQMMLDLDPPRTDVGPLAAGFLAGWREVYDRPYQGELPPGPILVVGAGSGNDVSAALRNTDRDVWAVDIDPTILALGARLHPERPYDNPRVHVVNDDARAFLTHTDQRFALVVFGFLDSHTLLSSFSSLRLDNYVYTQQSFERARDLLVEGGRVSVTFASQPAWLDRRFEALLTGVFGPVEALHEGALADIYLGTRGPAPVPSTVLVPTDDWPFLYLERPTIPSHYLAFLTIALALGGGALLALPREKRTLEAPYFLLGAAFFLLETSSVTSLSLLFGSTWWVNLVVFSGILVLVLLGNLTSTAVPGVPRSAWFACLGGAVLLAWAVPVSAILPLPALLRPLAAVIVWLGPAYFAAILFGSLIREEEDLAPAYGSNVLGTVAGGVLEYLSLLLGLKALLLVTLGLYAAAFLGLRLQRRA